VHSRVRITVRITVRSVVISTRERTNDDDDDDGSLLRAHLFHGRVRLSTLLDSTRLDRTRVIIESSLASIDRIARDRILGVRSTMGTRDG